MTSLGYPIKPINYDASPEQIEFEIHEFYKQAYESFFQFNEECTALILKTITPEEISAYNKEIANLTNQIKRLK